MFEELSQVEKGKIKNGGRDRKEAKKNGPKENVVPCDKNAVSVIS